MVPKLDFRSYGADPAGVGIDDSAADCDPGAEAELIGCILAEGADEVASAEVLTVLMPH